MEVMAVVNVREDQSAKNGYYLEIHSKYTDFLNEFSYMNFYAEEMIFFAIPAQEKLQILVEKTDQYNNKILINKGVQIENRWEVSIRDEMKRWPFRTTKHFNLSPGDKILLVY